MKHRIISEKNASTQDPSQLLGEFRLFGRSAHLCTVPKTVFKSACLIKVFWGENPPRPMYIGKTEREKK